MQRRIVTPTANVWVALKFNGFLHSCVIVNVGANNLSIGFDQVDPSTNFFTLVPSQELVIEPFDTSLENPQKVHTDTIWYNDNGLVTTFEIIFTCKGKGDKN